ncbi:TetR/AcrR family transcriptional regulator C-terminal domain-containing protein [Nonomuraea sp. NPDC050643]|uniref:TetR/AcrR family transcriptional regulator C-terminal domain-containing protein n=1 Tax=Nonomuraea sp. NPDC050643 TaxID=3155660 RepID=UPI0033E884D0
MCGSFALIRQRAAGRAERPGEAAGRVLADADRGGRLDVPDRLRAARQFVLLPAAEGRVRSPLGTQPLTDAERQEIARETAELIVRAHRPAADPTAGPAGRTG